MLAAAVAAAALAATGGSGSVFSVLDYGAKADGVTYDTDAVRKAAAALRAAGGGELLFPAGKTVLTAPFNLSSHSILTVAEGATIICSTRGEDYDLVQVLPWIPFSSFAAPGYWPQPCIYYDGEAENLYPDGGRNITIQGPGTIDGQGKGWWECANPPKGGSWKEADLTPPCLTSPPYDAAIVANKSNTLGGGRPHLLIVRNATDVIMVRCWGGVVLGRGWVRCWEGGRVCVSVPSTNTV